MFPTKAVAAWKALDDGQRADLIASYFKSAGGWNTPGWLDISPSVSSYSDPVYVVTAKKSVEATAHRGRSREMSVGDWSGGRQEWR